MTDALLVTSSFLPGRGGIETYLAALCDEVAPRLAVLAPGSRDRAPLPEGLSYPVTPGPPGMLVPQPRTVAAIAEAAAAHRTDRVLFGTPWPLVLLGPHLKRKGLRYSVIVHGAEMLVPSVVPGVARLVRRGLLGADVLFAVSRFTAGKLMAFLGSPRSPSVEVLRARVDIERFHPSVDPGPARELLGLTTDRKVILCFGRLVPRKGVDRLIRAFPEIQTRVPQATILVAGTGPEERKLKDLAAPFGAGVVFAGRVPEDLAPAVYRAADVFALPVVDRYRGLEVEGLGVVLLEASATSIPCVTGRSGGTPEAVVDGTTGFVIDATDTGALVDRVAGLLENETLARRLGAAGRAHVIESFYGPERLRPLIEWLG